MILLQNPKWVEKNKQVRCWESGECCFAFLSVASKHELHPVKVLCLKPLTSMTDRHKNTSDKMLKITTSEISIIISHYIYLKGKICLYIFSYYMYFLN